MSDINRTEEFLDKYKQMETLVRNEYNLDNNESVMNFLINNKDFKVIENELDLCRDTRNLLSHNPKINGEYAVYPSEEMIKLLDNVIQKVARPLKASNVMVKKSELCYMSMTDKVQDAMSVMKENSYKHIPILEDGVLVGLFSAKTVLDIMVSEGADTFSAEITFDKIQKYISIENVASNKFAFVGNSTLVSEVKDMFKEDVDSKERINIIFVTQHGKRDGKLLGIITAWEIASVN